MAINEMTVKVNVHIDVDGKPISTLTDLPVSAVMHEHGEGLAIYVHLDGAKLAKAMMPHITGLVRQNSHTEGAI